jgi:hypothetical protein
MIYVSSCQNCSKLLIIYRLRDHRKFMKFSGVKPCFRPVRSNFQKVFSLFSVILRGESYGKRPEYEVFSFLRLLDLFLRISTCFRLIRSCFQVFLNCLRGSHKLKSNLNPVSSCFKAFKRCMRPIYLVRFDAIISGRPLKIRKKHKI